MLSTPFPQFNMSTTQSHPLIVPASTECLVEIREYIKVLALEAGLSEFDTMNVILAVDEACANIIQHAYRNDRSKSITISVSYDSQAIQIRIIDNSDPFDPSKADLPDMRRYFAERRHHGLGILLMTRVMDSIEYLTADASRAFNTLVLTKRR